MTVFDCIVKLLTKVTLTGTNGALVVYVCVYVVPFVKGQGRFSLQAFESTGIGTVTIPNSSAVIETEAVGVF